MTFQEYPKALYASDGAMKIVHTREEEFETLEGWGMELPVIPLIGQDANEDPGTGEHILVVKNELLRAEIATLMAEIDVQARKLAEAEEKVEAKSAKLAKAEKATAAAHKRANAAEAELAKAKAKA